MSIAAPPRPPRPPRPSDPVRRDEVEALVDALIEEARQRARRRRRRNMAIVTLVALVGAALFALLGRSAQSQTASPALSARSSVAAPAGRVRIQLEGIVHGAESRYVGEGRFIISGAIQDRGTFRLRLGIHPDTGDPYLLTLSGAKGTIRVRGDGPNGGQKRQWRVTGGTKAYAGLSGRGRVQGHVNHSFALTMTGRVSR